MPITWVTETRARLGIIGLLWMFLGLSQPASAQGLPTNSGTKTDRLAAAIAYARQAGAIRLIVRVKPPAPPPPGVRSNLLAATAAASLEVTTALASSPESTDTHTLTPSLISVTATAQGVQQLAGDPRIEDVFIDQLADPLLMNSVPAIEATKLHQKGITGKGYVVAILDTGVDATHPALKGKVVSEACYSTTVMSPGSESLCPNGDSSSTAAGSGAPCSQLLVGCEHGTHVAGIAASAAGKFNGTDIEGVAPGASIISIQVFSKLTGEKLCGPGIIACIKSWESDQIAALQHVLELAPQFKIAAVNMSLGNFEGHPDTCDTDTIKSNIDALRARGILTVVAAGNYPNMPGLTLPACVSSAVSVGASDGTSSLATTVSSRAKYLTLLAPGVQIHSTWPVSMGGGYRALNGTSMAAPHVAGTLALLRVQFPKASADELEQALVAGMPKLADPYTNISYPRLDASIALANLSGSTPAAALATGKPSEAPVASAGSEATGEEGQSIGRFIATLPTGSSLTKPSDTLTPRERQTILEETKLTPRQFSITLPQKLADKLSEKMVIQKNEAASPLETLPPATPKN